MGVLAFDTLLRGLKRAGGAGPLDPVYYLHGDEDVLKDEAIQALLEAALDPGTRDFNLDQRSAEDLDPQGFDAVVNTPPMLAGRRAVIVRGVELLKRKAAVRAALLRYLAAPNPTTVLVLVQGAAEKPEADIAARATAIDAERLSPDRVPRWLAHRARHLGVAIEPEAAELLSVAVEHDLTALVPELNKLAGLAAGRPITAADVRAQVGVRHGETVYDLIDAALERRPAAAAHLVEPVLAQAGMTGVKLVTALGTAFVGTALARAELDGGVSRARLADAVFRHLLAVRPYGVRNWKDEAIRWARAAERWTAAELSRALRRLLAADRALKGTTVTDDRGIVMQLVVELGVTAREAA